MDTTSASPWVSAGSSTSCEVGGGAGTIFTQLLAALIQSQCLLKDRSAYPEDTVGLLPEYDFVVVGAGSAGSVVAARLSENPDWRVLLIEAGGDPPPTSDVPQLHGMLLKTEVDWSYLTEPDGRACLAFIDGRCSWPRGKMLGGSSSINSMLYIRGSPQDYDGWAALGNSGWAYEDVLPYFRKLEAFDEEELKARPETTLVHGRTGEIQVTKLPHSGRLQDTLNAAAVELGLKIIEDFSAEPNLGFGQLHCNVKNGTRWSAARGYLGPAKERPNLHVIKFAYVTKVLIDPQLQTVYGVKYLKDGVTRDVRVRKEVIISAGAINTPQILMHSGVGPKDHLDEVGVPVIKDLKVGCNLQDHIAYVGLFYMMKPVTNDVLVEAAFEYLVNRTGYLASIGLGSYTGFITTGKGPQEITIFSDTDTTNFADVQMFYTVLESAHPSSTRLYAHTLNYNREATEALMKLTEEEDALMVVPTLLAPTSRGRIRLRSADPTELPLIEPGYYDDPRDLENSLAGVEFAHRMGSTEAMRAAGISVKDLPLRACSDQPPLTPQYWRCALPYLTASMYHPAGSAKMGPPSDADAVVDPRLRVYGVRGLRVADASIMPLVTRCNTNVPTMMIGEKAADMIADDWFLDEQRLFGENCAPGESYVFTDPI